VVVSSGLVVVVDPWVVVVEPWVVVVPQVHSGGAVVLVVEHVVVVVESWLVAPTEGAIAPTARRMSARTASTVPDRRALTLERCDISAPSAHSPLRCPTRSLYPVRLLR
jgi:hypothetical protein